MWKRLMQQVIFTKIIFTKNSKVLYVMSVEMISATSEKER